MSSLLFVLKQLRFRCAQSAEKWFSLKESSPPTSEQIVTRGGVILIGGYLLTNFHDATVRLGDTLVVLGALFWSTHIIFTGIIITKYNLPLTLGAVQTLIVAILSFIIGIIYEEFILNNILMEIYSILYAGILSGGFAFVLQIYAQRNITPAPAAIIFSLEGVFATIAAWFILNQILDINNLLGCFFILCGVLLSQLLPLAKEKYT